MVKSSETLVFYNLIGREFETSSGGWKYNLCYKKNICRQKIINKQALFLISLLTSFKTGIIIMRLQRIWDQRNANASKIALLYR